VSGLVRERMGHSSEELEFWARAHFPKIYNPETEKFDLDVVDDAQNPETVEFDMGVVYDAIGKSNSVINHVLIYADQNLFSIISTIVSLSSIFKAVYFILFYVEGTSCPTATGSGGTGSKQMRTYIRLLKSVRRLCARKPFEY